MVKFTGVLSGIMAASRKVGKARCKCSIKIIFIKQTGSGKSTQNKDQKQGEINRQRGQAITHGLGQARQSKTKKIHNSKCFAKAKWGQSYASQSICANDSLLIASLITVNALSVWKFLVPYSLDSGVNLDEIFMLMFL